MRVDLSKLSAKEIRQLHEAGVLKDMIAGAKNDVGEGVPFMHPAYNTTPNQPNDGGIFTAPGVRPDMFSTLQQPIGLSAYLVPEPSDIAEERVEILTGQTDASGTNPDSFCGDPVTPGNLKVCQQLYTFGKLHVGSKKLEISTTGFKANRAVQPRVILNRAMNDPLLPDVLQDPNVDFMSEDAQALYELGTLVRRSISLVLADGNPATAAAAARPGWIKEINGTDQLIKTGHTDTISLDACPAADSIVATWGGDIAGSVDGLSLVEYVTELVYGRTLLARQVGMEATTWAFRMNPDAWLSFTNNWACGYATTFCSSDAAGMPIGRTATDINNLRLEMLNGEFLWVNGRRYPVILDDAMPIDDGGGNYRKVDLEFIPLFWNGERLLKFEYLDTGNETQARIAGHFSPESYVLNNGMYRVYWERTKACAQMILDANLRMWHRAPFLAFKLQDLLYVSNLNTVGFRHFAPGMTGHVNGGVVSRLVNG